MMNYKELVAKLRSTVSESKRELLDAAADTIEALVADLKLSDHVELCDLCAHCQDPRQCEGTDFDCFSCPFDCPCKVSRDSECFEWRGIQKEV